MRRLSFYTAISPSVHDIEGPLNIYPGIESGFFNGNRQGTCSKVNYHIRTLHHLFDLIIIEKISFHKFGSDGNRSAEYLRQ